MRVGLLSALHKFMPDVKLTAFCTRRSLTHILHSPLSVLRCRLVLRLLYVTRITPGSNRHTLLPRPACSVLEKWTRPLTAGPRLQPTPSHYAKTLVRRDSSSVYDSSTLLYAHLVLIVLLHQPCTSTGTTSSLSQQLPHFLHASYPCICFLTARVLLLCNPALPTHHRHHPQRWGHGGIAHTINGPTAAQNLSARPRSHRSVHPSF